MAKGLLDFPTTVKEAVDWLVRIQEGNFFTKLYMVIRNMFDDNASMQFGMSDISALCNAIQGFHHKIKNKVEGRYTDKYKASQWPHCGTENMCGCETSSKNKCEHGSCCAKCPLRRMAVFFCFSISLLHQRFSDLKQECESKSTHKLSHPDSSDRLGYHFHVEGYQGSDMSNTVHGSALIPKLQNVIQTLDRLNKHLAEDFSRCKMKYLRANNISSQRLSAHPSSIYEMLLWLCGLPFCKAFPDLMNHITDKAKDLLVPFYETYQSVPEGFRRDIWSLVTQIPTLLHGFHRSHGPFLGELSRIISGKRFQYPTDVNGLISTLWDYLYKSYCTLKFLCLMCNRSPQNGGWHECEYGKNVNACSKHNTFRCKQCNVSTSRTHDGCLQAFLTASSNTSETSAFCNPKYAPMGLVTKDFSGYINIGGFILNFLTDFVGEGSALLSKVKNYGLFCRVLSPLFILLNQPPGSLSALFSFVLCFGRAVRLKSQGQRFVNILQLATSDSNRCSIKGFLRTLKRCVSRKEHNTSNSTQHNKNLLYVTGCANSSGSHTSGECPPYLYPMDLEIFRRVFIMEFAYIVLQWLSQKNFIDELYKEFVKMSNEVNDVACLLPSKHHCEILQCHHMHPVLFKHGFTFGGSLHLVSGNATCSDFDSRLKEVYGGKSALRRLYDAANKLSSEGCPRVFANSSLPPRKLKSPSGGPRLRSEEEDDEDESGASDTDSEGKESPSPPTPPPPSTPAATTASRVRRSLQSSLLMCPQSVKECIDWLLCVGGYECANAATYGGCQLYRDHLMLASSASSGFIPNLVAALCTVGFKLSGQLGDAPSTDGICHSDLHGLTASLACLMGYTVPSGSNNPISSVAVCNPSVAHGIASGTYRPKYSGHQWPVCNGVYCACRANYAGRPCAGSRCDECPERACARIFCLIVPVVYAALNFLSDMLQLSDGSSSNRSYSQWRSHIFCDTTHSLGIYMKLLGFRDGDLRGVNGEKLHNCLANAVQQLGRATAWIHCSLGSGRDGTVKFLLTSANVKTLPPPISVRDSLLWILFMPYCCSDFPIVMRYLGHKTQSVTEGSSGSRRAIASQSTLSSLLTTAVLVMLGAEYAAGVKAHESSTSSSVNQQCTLFAAIETLSQGCPLYYYGNTYGDAAGSRGVTLRMLMSFLPIVDWGVSQLWSAFCGTRNSDGISNTYNRHGYALSDLGFLNYATSSTILPHGIPPRDLWQYAYDLYAGAASHLSVECVSRVPRHPLRSPVTIRAMMLWLFCLIPCGQLNGLSSLGNSINNVIKWCPLALSSARVSSSTSGHDILQQFHVTMYHFMVTVPSVFLVMEGNLAGMFTDMYQFLAISVTGLYKAPRDSSHSLASSTVGVVERQFCTTVYIVYMVFWYLHQRCTPSSSDTISRKLHLGLWATSDSFTSGSLARFVEFLGFQRPPGHSAVSQATPLHGSSPSLSTQNVHNVLYPWFEPGNSSNRLSPLCFMFNVAVEYISTVQSTGLTTTASQSTPSKVRDILLWLVGLPIVIGFPDNGTLSSKGVAVSEIPQKLNALKNTHSILPSNGRRPFQSLNMNDFQTLLMYSTVCSMQLIQCIEGDVSSVYSYLSGMSDWSFNQSSYNSCLLKPLCDYVYVVTVQLRFLGAQCSLPGDKGGWRDCNLDSHTARSQEGSVSSLVCSCREVSDKSGTTQCSHGLLRAFLTSSSSISSVTKGNPFSRCFKGTISSEYNMSGYVPMGFNACSGHDRTGERIHDILCEFLDFPSSNSQSSATTSHRALTLLCQWLIALTHREPECLGDYIAFFQEFRESGEHSSVDSHCLFERPVFSNGALVKGVGTLASLLSGELKCTNGCDHHVVVYRYPTHAPP